MIPAKKPVAAVEPAGESPPRSAGEEVALPRGLAVALALLDVVIASGRKVGGFCALLALGWLYFRILALGQSLASIHPGARDPDLRQTLWTALLLVMAQGWDIPTDEIASHWVRLRGHRAPPPPRELRADAPRGRRLVRLAETIVIRLGRFMDLAVAVANKLGALAVLGYLAVLAGRLFAGATARDLYPNAADPSVSLLADVCVSLVVLGWWGTPFEQIVAFWRRLRQPA